MTIFELLDAHHATQRDVTNPEVMVATIKSEFSPPDVTYAHIQIRAYEYVAAFTPMAEVFRPVGRARLAPDGTITKMIADSNVRLADWHHVQELGAVVE